MVGVDLFCRLGEGRHGCLRLFALGYRVAPVACDFAMASAFSRASARVTRLQPPSPMSRRLP